MSLSLPRRLLVLVVLCLSLSGVTPLLLLAQQATPQAGASPFRVDPAECDVDPLTDEEIHALAVSEVSGSFATPPLQDVPFGAPDGEPADAETTEAITVLFRQFWACQNAGDLPRLFAILTEDEILQNFMPREITQAASQPVGPFAPENQTAIFAILDVEVLPDGRVGAFVVMDTANDSLPVEVNYQIAAETEDGWKVDDFICFLETGDLC